MGGSTLQDIFNEVKKQDEKKLITSEDDKRKINHHIFKIEELLEQIKELIKNI